MRLCRHYEILHFRHILKQRDLFFIKQVSFCMIFYMKKSLVSHFSLYRKEETILSKEQSKALFYTQGEEEVLKNLDTSVDGLSTAQAKERLDAYGYNELDEGEKRSLLSKFIDQFKDLMIIILLVAAALSVITEGMHGLTDACIILAVVVLNAAFGVYQEGQAEAAIEALKNMSSPMARVRVVMVM